MYPHLAFSMVCGGQLIESSVFILPSQNLPIHRPQKGERLGLIPVFKVSPLNGLHIACKLSLFRSTEMDLHNTQSGRAVSIRVNLRDGKKHNDQR